MAITSGICGDVARFEHSRAHGTRAGNRYEGWENFP